jgi:hypothetical protein
VDEKWNQEVLEFYADGNESTVSRIHKLFEISKGKYPDLFRNNNTIRLRNPTVFGIVTILQAYCVSKDPVVAQQLFESLLKTGGSLTSGEYPTPEDFRNLL